MPIGHCSVNHTKFTVFSLLPQATLVPGEDDVAYDVNIHLLVIKESNIYNLNRNSYKARMTSLSAG